MIRRCLLWEYDHLVASQYLLDYVDSETVRQHVQRALNRGEQYHQLKRALTQGNAGNLRFSSDEEQELWDACSRLLVNAIPLLQHPHALRRRRAEGGAW